MIRVFVKCCGSDPSSDRLSKANNELAKLGQTGKHSNVELLAKQKDENGCSEDYFDLECGGV